MQPFAFPTKTRRTQVSILAALLPFCLCFVFWLYWEWQYARTLDLLNAAAKGDTAAVQTSLDNGVHPDSESQRRQTAIEIATYSGYKEVVSLLLSRGANPNKGLRMAAKKGRAEILAMLLARGANISGETGASLLGAAVESGNIATVNLLLQQGVDVNAPDEDGRPAIVHTMWFNAEAIYAVLVQHGADVNARSTDGVNALMQAACIGNAAICRDLLRRGVDVNVRDNEGRTPLIYAVYFNRGDGQDKSTPDILPLLKILLQSGADVNIQDISGRTALRYATEFQMSKVKTFLRKAGACL